MIIETKFEIGNTVWFMWDNKPVQDIIETMTITVNYPRRNPPDYNGREVGVIYGFTRKEQVIHQNDLFLTKEELIASL